MRKTIVLIALSLTTICACVHAEGNLSEAEKATVIDGINVALEENYVFPARVSAFNEALNERIESGRYQDVRDYEAFAELMTSDLVDITQDKHIALVYNPRFIADRWAELEAQTDLETSDLGDERTTETTTTVDWNQWFAVHDNFGFETVEILEGNIGYIKFDFFYFNDWFQPKIDAAMGFVSDTEALIIDVTENGGGYSPTDAYLASYFFETDEDGIWSSSYHRPRDETEIVRLFDMLGEERYLNRPILVLVSENTFSLAERLAYGLKHFQKATIVGEKTAGAAHGIDIFELGENFFIQVSVLHNIHRITDKDWEGIGVIPDIQTPKENALRTAHLAALEMLIGSTGQDRIREVYESARDSLVQLEQ